MVQHGPDVEVRFIAAAARRYWNRIPPPGAPAGGGGRPGGPRPVAAGTGLAADRPGGPFSLGIERLSHPQAVDLIPSPAYIVLSAATTVRHPTHRPSELWQTDFTYLQVVGWGWYYLSTVLDDDSRYIIAWALRTSMQTADVTETLETWPGPRPAWTASASCIAPGSSVTTGRATSRPSGRRIWSGMALGIREVHRITR